MKHGIYQVACDKYEIWKTGEFISSYSSLVVAMLIAAQMDLPIKLQNQKPEEKTK